MEQMLTINQEKDNSLLFSVDIQGIDDDNVRVRFSIVLSDMGLNFDCEHKQDKEWKVTIPKLPFVEPGKYKCVIEVIANDYYFTAMEGELKVAAAPKVRATTVKAEKGEEKEEEVEKPKEPAVTASIISVESETHSEDHLATELEDKSLPDINREKVRDVLRELKIDTAPVRKFKPLKDFIGQ